MGKGSWIEGFGQQAAGGILGAAMGLALQRGQDRRQIRQQNKLQNLEIQGQKEMAQFNYAQQMKMWQDTNYAAQMEQLKKAGLNPGLIYGMGGGGGATVNAATGNVSGGHAAGGVGEAIGMMQQGSQLGLMKAQMDLIKAQTEKTKAEAGAIPTGVEKTKQETINLKTQNALDELEKAFQEDTYKNRESIINLSLSKLIEEVKIIENNREISDETKDEQVKIIMQDLVNKVKQGLQLDKQNAKTEKETYYIERQIRALDQQININKLDEDAAKAGINPKAGTMLKTGYNIIQIIRKIIGL